MYLRKKWGENKFRVLMNRDSSVWMFQLKQLTDRTNHRGLNFCPTAEWCHVCIRDQTTCWLKEIKSINKKGKTCVKPHLTCTNRKSLEPQRRILNQLHSARRCFGSFEDVPPLITAFMPPCWLKCEFIVKVYYVLLPLLPVISFYTHLDIINFIEPTRKTCLIYSFYSNFI